MLGELSRFLWKQHLYLYTEESPLSSYSVIRSSPNVIPYEYNNPGRSMQYNDHASPGLTWPNQQIGGHGVELVRGTQDSFLTPGSLVSRNLLASQDSIPS